MATKRLIKENGIVLEKIFKEATEEFKGQDGRIIPAQPNRYIVKIVSSAQKSKELGFVDSTILDYKVDEKLYNLIKPMEEVLVGYELSVSNSNSRFIPSSVELIK